MRSPNCSAVRASGIRFHPSYQIKMNFSFGDHFAHRAQIRLYTKQNQKRKTLLRFIVGRHWRTLPFIRLLFPFPALPFPFPFHLFIVTITLESKLALAKIALWKRMELLWGHARLQLPGPTLSQKERQAERKREGLKKKESETGAEEQERVAFLFSVPQLWILLTYISEYFATSSRKAISSP